MEHRGGIVQLACKYLSDSEPANNGCVSFCNSAVGVLENPARVVSHVSV